MTFDVQERHALLLKTTPGLRLFALVDGVQYTRHHEQPLAPLSSRRALFDGTKDAHLAHAGPWLVDVALADSAYVAQLVEFEKAAPAVTWLISPMNLDDIANLLIQRLDTRLPDGRTALVRFFDPRVLLGLVEILDGSQREEFFAHIYEWHLLRNGKRAWIGRQYADAQ